MKLNKIFGVALTMTLALGFTSCKEDEPDQSYSVITPTMAEQNDFDKWLEVNFNKPYNIDFKYRYEDIEGNLDYYLVPADFKASVMMAHLVKHFCVEAYNEVADVHFTRRYFPKMFFMLGEWEYKNNGTITLGTAEGGRKIVLMGLNKLEDYLATATNLNTRYFKTIHHEFTHILNQNVPIPPDFQLVTGKDYVSDGWSTAPYNANFIDRGFVSAYSQNSPTEDFADVMSYYVTDSAADWEARIGGASDAGKAAINQKLDIVKSYMKTYYNIDMDHLREVLQRRQQEIKDGKVELLDLSVDK